MHIFKTTNGAIVRIERGEDVFGSLYEAARELELSSLWIQGIGAVKKATLSFFDMETRAYIDKTFEKPLEVTSLTGNLTHVDDEPFLHLHGTFSDVDFNAYAGHVKALTVGVTLEVLLTALPPELTRELDEDTGLNLLSH